MFVATTSQIKIIDFIKKCSNKENLLALILKNLEEFNPEYIEMENKLKNSRLKEKIDFKVYSYSFSQPKEIEHIAKYIEFEKPDIVIILSDTPIEGFNRKIFEKFQAEDSFLLVKINRNKNKLNGKGYDIIYDAVFPSMEEALDFFEKACFLLSPKKKASDVSKNKTTLDKSVYIGNVKDFFENLSHQMEIPKTRNYELSATNNSSNINTQSQLNNSIAMEANHTPSQDANILLVIETLKDLKDSIEELKEMIEKQNQLKKKESKEKLNNSYFIVNLITIVLLVLLIGILIFYK
jgi:hypothetical protein